MLFFGSNGVMFGNIYPKREASCHERQRAKEKVVQRVGKTLGGGVDDVWIFRDSATRVSFPVRVFLHPGHYSFDDDRPFSGYQKKDDQKKEGEECRHNKQVLARMMPKSIISRYRADGCCVASRYPKDMTPQRGLRQPGHQAFSL